MKFKISALLIIIVTFLLLCSTNSNAQKASYNQCIGVNPVTLLYNGTFSATYEQKIAPKNSFTLSGYYWSYYNMVAYGFGGSYRWYLKAFDDGKKCIQGFSVAPTLAIGFWSWNGNQALNNEYGGTSVAIGAEAAYKWVWDNFYIEPILSLSINMTNIHGLQNYRPFNLGANIGYAW
jgi:hypothetical protein